LVSGTVIQGAVVVVSKEMVNKSHAFKCVATNYYNGTIHENSTTVIFDVVRGDLHLPASTFCTSFTFFKPVFVTPTKLQITPSMSSISIKAGGHYPIGDS